MLTRIVSSVSEGDDFITSLWEVHLKVKKDGYVQVGSSLSSYARGEALTKNSHSHLGFSAPTT